MTRTIELTPVASVDLEADGFYVIRAESGDLILSLSAHNTPRALGSFAFYLTVGMVDQLHAFAHAHNDESGKAGVA
jgi:hypothetical protein